MLSFPVPTPLSVVQYAGQTLWSATLEPVNPTEMLTDAFWSFFWSLSAPTLCCLAVVALLIVAWLVSLGKRLVKWSFFVGGVACYVYGALFLGCLPSLPWYCVALAAYAWHRACDAAVSAATGSVWNAVFRVSHKAKSFVLTFLLAVAVCVLEEVRKVSSKVLDLLRGVRQVPSAVLPGLSQVAQAIAAVLFNAYRAIDSVMEVAFTVVPVVAVTKATLVASFQAAVVAAAAICNGTAAVGGKFVAIVAAAPRASPKFIVALPRLVLWTLPCFFARSILKAVLAPILLPLAFVKFCLGKFCSSLRLVFVVVPRFVVCAVASFVR